MDLTGLPILAFIAGILTFLAPCTLPLLPAYLGFVSGASLEDLKDPDKARRARRKIFVNGLFFVIGFSAIFILLGTLAGFIGASLGQHRIWLSRIGGVFVIIFGLFMLDIIKLPRFGSGGLKTFAIFERGKALNSLILGLAFGAGWTPCVGPILGTILLLAAAKTTAFVGAGLLLIYSAGLAAPFLLIALGIGSAGKYIGKFTRSLHIISIIGGLFLIFLGFLLVTNNLGIWIAWFFRTFDFINYDALIDYF